MSQASPATSASSRRAALWQRSKQLLCRYRKVLYAALALFILFGVVGYFWLPGFAKGKVEALLSEKLHRPVTVQKIDINPYTLELTLHDFRIGEREGDGSLFKFETLYINLSTASIARRAPVVSAVTIKAPQIHLSRYKDGKLSITDLIEEFANQPESEPSRFSISNVLIEGGRIDFDDQLKGSHQKISEMNIGVPFVANFESSEEVWVQPHFKARINDGSTIVLEGRARPFAGKREATIDVKLDNLDLTGVDEYAPPLQGIRLGSGKLDTQLELTFAQPENKPASINLSGDITLRELLVDNTANVPWNLKGEKLVLHLKDFDPALTRPINVALDGTNLHLKQGSNPEMVLNTLALTDVLVDTTARTAALALDATVNGHGHLKTSGNAAWAPVSADFKVDAKELDLVALQGWAGDRFNAVLTKGNLSFQGDIKAAGAPLNVAVNGDGRLGDFNVLDKINAVDLLRWRSLDISGINVTTAPLSVDLKSVSLADFFARVVMSQEGKLNLKDLVRKEKGAEPTSVANPPAEPVDKDVSKNIKGGTVTTAEIPEKPKATPVRIGQVLLQGGSVNFNDRFIKPNYRANLTNLAGKIGPLDPGKPGNVEVRGSIERTAPLEIMGKVDPFGKELYVDLTAKAKGIDLPTFSPYSGKYIGYAIQKGKLSVDVHYKVENGQLVAENNIFLDQLTLGEKIESPDAISIPISLALALLKNSRGEIDLHLPVSGSLSDPEFSLGSVIGTVIKNLIVKIVTSPFTLLSSIFGGGGADLSQLDFAPGRAQITPDAEKNLQSLQKALSERPALKLEITGVADADNDKDALKRAVMERRVKAQKQTELAKRGEASGSLSDIQISSAEYPKYLELAYKNEKFDKPRNLIGMAKSLPVPEMEQLMLANIPAGEDEMRSLAERRAKAALEWLLEKGVSSERIFVLQPKVEVLADGKKVAGRVEFSLR